MSSNLTRQVSKIHGFNEEQTQQRRIMWIQAWNKRKDFIENLNKEIAKLDDEEVFVDKKSKSSYYSDCVVNYDRENMEVF